ncbi:VWA domain-containing protein [Roseibium polysiphoniae]|uniref:VWA domain-containing protein n=1 Tax=Roseibium polysiphoniae TaxID=2571221 RepID=UPI003296AF5B
MNINHLSDILEAFHFIRPLWLMLLAPIAALWWLVRRAATKEIDLPDAIAPHLAKALTIGSQGHRRLRPIDGVASLLALLVLAAAGPTWSRVSNPLVADTAPLVVVLKVSKSMMATDIPPSRLERAKHKVLDLLEERSGAKTALVAYSGTAHQVVPPTEDPQVAIPFLEGLDPNVMPNDGEAARDALAMATAILADQTAPGAILFLLDRITDADLPAFGDHTVEDGPTVLFWLASRDSGAAEKLDQIAGTPVVELTADRSDVAAVQRQIKSAYEAALARDESQQWRDEGWIFSLPAAVLLLLWFRRGWTMHWAVVLVAASFAFATPEAHADGWRDWFFTPDQQGRMAFDNKDYQRAADLFEDPMWKAYALYRLGKYPEAAETFAWQESSNAAIGEGLALLKSRSYRPAVAAFEKAVARDPQNEAAQQNLELARYILDYIETTREQSDTGQESGIGADDVVYDNEAGRGADSQQPQEAASGDVAPETAEQWMRTVDTRTGDFLKSRFALEAARAPR